MAKKLKIFHPNKEKVRSRNFVAFGKANREVGGIRGRVKDKNNKVILEGTTLRHAPFWMIQFQGIPIGDSYTLEIIEHLSDLLLQSSHFSVELSKFLMIAYPIQGDTPCSDFTAYGTADDSSHVSGSLSGTNYSADGLWVQDGPNWALQFSGVPVDSTGKGYTLDVQNVSGSHDTSGPFNVVLCSLE